MVLQNNDDQAFSINADGFSLGAGTITRTLTLSGADLSILLSSPISGNLLQYNGTNWINVPSSTFGTGSVTNIATGTGLTGGPITNTGTISMGTSGVTAGTYGAGTSFPSITVDALGRITAATTVALGSIASQNANNVSITGGNINGAVVTGLSSPVNTSDAATKGYVDNATAGLTAKAAVRLATSGTNLVGTYNNGTSGVGATFTLTGTGALTIDGSAVLVGDSILIKDQTAALQNGIYTVTVVGTSGTSAVLTRRSDYNSSNNVFDGAYAVIEEGTINKGTLWITTFTGDQTYTIGTTSINFVELSVANQTVTFTGDVTGSGAGTIPTTLATVNANVGTFVVMSVNAKGLVTAASNLVVSGDVSGTSSAGSLSLTLGTSGVTAGTFGDNLHPAIITVNAKGIVTSASTGTTTLGTGSVTNIATGTGLTGGPITNTGTISMGTSGVTPGTYMQVTVDALGRVTSANTQGYTWVQISGTTQAGTTNTGYIPQNTALTTFTLPTTANVGDTIPFVGKGTGGWKIAQNAGQTIHFGTKNSTTGTAGSLSSTNQYHCVTLVCVTANTDWVVSNSVGNLIII